jgi:hypothetical protein
MEHYKVHGTSGLNFHRVPRYWCASRMSPIIRRTLFSAAVPTTNAIYLTQGRPALQGDPQRANRDSGRDSSRRNASRCDP